METLLLYFLKVNGLLIVFYLTYYLLLRKETFFQSNRWFLLLGIISSFVLPLITFTEIVWIDPEPIEYATNTYIPNTNIEASEISNLFNWQFFLTSVYIIVSIIFFIRIVFEVISFIRILKKSNKNKEGKIVLVETNKSQNPFSFFNYLVFNKSNFTEEELEMIIIHEKVHIAQRHSYDVLITKLLCIILWINPIVWLYRKAILENLEFIADYKTSEITNNIYQYQKTLLKVVACNNQLSITNQFYQSLIKKRIVMLNTNPSQKKNIWKYSLVVPFLIGFVFLFQIETKAQVREIEIVENDTRAVEVIQFIIDKNTTDAEIKKETEILKNEQGITLKVSGIKRNTKKEITAIKISFKDNEGNSGNISKKADNPIEPIRFFKELDSTGKGNVGFGGTSFHKNFEWTSDESINKNENVFIVKKDNLNKSTEIYLDGKKIDESELENIDSEIIKTVNVSDNGNKNVIIIKSKKDLDENDEHVFFINDNEVDKMDVDNLDPNKIKTVNVIKGDKKIVKVITKNSAGIPDDTEIFINGKKVTQEEFDNLEQNEIALMNISNINSKKRIEIQKKAKEEVEKEMKRIKIEWQEDSKKEDIKVQKAELEKMKAELKKKN
ncbi:M56 family metallopeptidase [Flavobacterium sp.]|uniref:M56 family metallopeptidase n=1 Tax=Flavobacterium sp. TaxID=239 RepID=UPI003D283E77